MKTIITFSLFLLHTISIGAQEASFSESYPATNLSNLAADLEYGDIHITVADVNDVQVEAFIDINDGKWNDYFTLKVESNGGEIKLLGELDNSLFDKANNIYSKAKWGNWKINNGEDKKDDREVIINGEKYTYEKSSYERENSINVDITVAVIIPRKLAINLETLYGSSKIENLSSDIKVDATYGEIEVTLDPNYKASEIDLSSTYSTVDLAIPASMGINLEMKTGYGKIYTDLDFKPDFVNDSKECWMGDEVKATLNNGGVDVDLHSGYSNLYLRKK